MDPGRFSEMRNCCKQRPLKRIETAALISAGNIFADVYACLQSRGSTATRTGASLLASTIFPPGGSFESHRGSWLPFQLVGYTELGP